MSNKKQSMKLYTEEQVVSMLDRARMHKQDDTEMFTNEYLLSQATPIELPSDEEIVNEAYAQRAMVFSFTDGAKWMRYKIQGGNE